MKYRASRIDQNPLDYFLQSASEGPFLQVADVVLRENKDPKEVFAHLIRIATDSKWSHSAILYLISDPYQGFNNTFLVEAKTKGIHLASWRNEVIPFDEFTVGIKRPVLDWYVENPYEQSRHNPCDPEDTHGIGYLRHVRGIAIDQINGLYDHTTVYELAALYAARAARRHLNAVPQVAEAATAVANLFKKWDEKSDSAESVLRFICSGLVQYSFFEALRRRIINDLAIPEHREAGLSNLSNLHRVIYRDDPMGLVPRYIEQVQSGELDIRDKVPEDLLDLLKTATPADFNNSPNLKWHYVILKGVIWHIEEANADYAPTSSDESEVLGMLQTEHRS
ncbi:hypothetical protein KDAU_41450 [Dictyobacter aurantiacus]|uniref:Uncharacterized protein n=2 Tax=Dictyobacter aurantiacus TaxID=1936993 RepID=A0A401ZIY5_9CHLR|nr:hypothetical protein KDAU_41450 [Dictyobacter aurantiacus]